MSTKTRPSDRSDRYLHSSPTRIQGREPEDPSHPSPTAVERLDLALLGMAENGQAPPCYGLGGFTSDDPLERRIAAPICEHCPIRELCTAAADERRESFGVWGGRDRTPRAYKPRSTAA